jgi:hypothetical protein
MIAILVLASRAIGNKLGLNPWLVGSLLGVSLGYLHVVLSRHLKRNAYPKCMNGTCGSGDYTIIGSDSRGMTLTCRCGQQYVYRRGKFQILERNGEIRRYKREKLPGYWVDDEKGKGGSPVNRSDRGQLRKL